MGGDRSEVTAIIWEQISGILRTWGLRTKCVIGANLTSNTEIPFHFKPKLDEVPSSRL